MIFLLVVGAGWVGWEAFLDVTARGRVDPMLQPALHQHALVNVAVILGFPPEDFHIRLFQGYGVVSGVQGSTVLMNRVKPEDVRRIGHYYWVRRITPQS